jgi:hypothetical protein
MLERQTMPADRPPLGKISSELTSPLLSTWRECESELQENQRGGDACTGLEAMSVQSWRQAPIGGSILEDYSTPSEEL